MRVRVLGAVEVGHRKAAILDLVLLDELPGEAGVREDLGRQLDVLEALHAVGDDAGLGASRG